MAGGIEKCFGKNWREEEQGGGIVVQKKKASLVAKNIVVLVVDNVKMVLIGVKGLCWCSISTGGVC